MSSRGVFAHDGSCALIADEQRIEIRRVVNLSAYARDSGSAILGVRIFDLTTSGCRLTCDAVLEPATSIWLKIPGLTPRRAMIRWVNDGEAGCEFDAEISEQTLVEVAATAQSAAARTRQRLKGHFG